MRLQVNLAGLFRGDVCIDLRRCRTGVTHEILHHPEIGSTVKQMRCEAMAQCMSVEIRVEPSLQGIAFYQTLHASGAQASAKSVQEQSRL